MSKALTFICITSYFKGADFISACKKEGNTVFLITDKSLQEEPWPWDSIDQVFYMEGAYSSGWIMDHLNKGIAWLMQANQIDRVVALDDFDVERAAAIREEFRIPGMGQTTVRHFRDKLAMRMKAKEAGINVPGFSSLFNDLEITEFAESCPGPWVIKPRSEASATGIKKVHNKEELWQAVHELGEERPNYLVEQFKPGKVFHVDTLSSEGKIKFIRVSQYLSPPLNVAHEGGIFRSHTVTYGSAEDKALQKLTKEVMKAFGMQFSAAHTEFIQTEEDGQYYFLETSSRVGGAHLAEMVEFSSGINLWSEWAKIETAMAKGEGYKLPKTTKDYTGIIVSLARQEWPDQSVFNDPEVVWKINKAYHVGLIVKSGKKERVLELLDKFADIVQRKFHASAPAPDKTNF